MSERPSPRALYVLAALISVEGAALGVVTISLVIEIFAASPASIVTAVALAVTSAIGAAGLVFLGISTLRRRPWIRGAALSWHILQALVGVSILQAKSPVVGWALIVPAALVVVLVLTKSVIASTARPPR